MIQAYINERYPGYEEIADSYEDFLRSKGRLLFATSRGFFTYELKGDAAIMYDIYVKPDARKSGEAWRMFNAFHKLAILAKKRVLIGIRDTIGDNQEYGKIVLKAAGFKPAQQLKTQEVFIREV